MSLINDALRQADADQCRRDAGAEPPAPPTLPTEETREPQNPPTPRGRSPWTVVLAAGLLVLVGLTAYGLWWGVGRARETAGLAVQSATAAAEKAVQQPSAAEAAAEAEAEPTPGAPATSVQTSTGLAGEAGAATPDDTAPADHPGPESGGSDGLAEAGGRPDGEPAVAAAVSAEPSSGGEAALGIAESWTPDLLLRDAPHAGAASAGPDGPGGAAPVLFDRLLAALQAAVRGAPPAPPTVAPAGQMPAEQTPAGPGRPPASTLPGPPGADGSAAATEKQPETARAKNRGKGADGGLFGGGPAAPKKPAPLPPVDTSAFTISSIMTGPGGGLAIINGRPVREGETVAGAKVIRISGRAVELEIDGRRATVGM